MVMSSPLLYNFCHADNSRIHPQSIKIYLGMDAYFNCTSSGKVSWKIPKGSITVNNIYIVERTLHIKNATKLNAGAYQCSGITSQNEEFLAMGQFIVVGV